MAWVAIGTAVASTFVQGMMEGDEKGAGAAGGAGSQALAQAMKHGQTEEMTRRKLIEPSEATTTKETAEILARTMAAIENNGPNAMERIVESLMRDMQTTQGGRIPPGIVTPGGETKVPKVQAVKLAELEQQQEEEEEPFVRPFLFG